MFKMQFTDIYIGVETKCILQMPPFYKSVQMKHANKILTIAIKYHNINGLFYCRNGLIYECNKYYHHWCIYNNCGYYITLDSFNPNDVDCLPLVISPWVDNFDKFAIWSILSPKFDKMRTFLPFREMNQYCNPDGDILYLYNADIMVYALKRNRYFKIYYGNMRFKFNSERIKIKFNGHKIKFHRTYSAVINMFNIHCTLMYSDLTKSAFNVFIDSLTSRRLKSNLLVFDITFDSFVTFLTSNFRFDF